MPIPKLTKSGQEIDASKPTLTKSYPISPKGSLYRPTPAPLPAFPVQRHGGLPHPGTLGLITLRFNWAVERLAKTDPAKANLIRQNPWNFSLHDVE